MNELLDPLGQHIWGGEPGEFIYSVQRDRAADRFEICVFAPRFLERVARNPSMEPILSSSLVALGAESIVFSSTPPSSISRGTRPVEAGPLFRATYSLAGARPGNMRLFMRVGDAHGTFAEMKVPFEVEVANSDSCEHNLTHRVRIHLHSVAWSDRSTLLIHGTVENIGAHEWNSLEAPYLLGIRVVSIAGQPRLAMEERCYLSSPVVKPLERVEFRHECSFGELPLGPYALYLDMVKEGFFWFCPNHTMATTIFCTRTALELEADTFNVIVIVPKLPEYQRSADGRAIIDLVAILRPYAGEMSLLVENDGTSEESLKTLSFLGEMDVTYELLNLYRVREEQAKTLLIAFDMEPTHRVIKEIVSRFAGVTELSDVIAAPPALIPFEQILKSAAEKHKSGVLYWAIPKQFEDPPLL